jgi:NitT/TauT family transport system ATP-binding protein
LRDVRFTVHDGEIVSLVGPSGAGKSTLLNIIGGLITPSAGSVRFLQGGAECGLPKTGYVFQSPRLMPWLTALENLTLVLPQIDAQAIAGSLLQRVGLAGSEHKYPGQLSGGMQRRVALARAFAVKPELLLMDEPFVSLDLPTAAQLRQQMLELWASERPVVLFVTHDFTEALTVADRVIFFSAHPGTPVLDIPVALTRPRDREEDVLQLRRDLLQRYPDILRGTERLPANTTTVQDAV